MPDPNTQIVAKGGYVRAHEARGTGDVNLHRLRPAIGYDTLMRCGAEQTI